MPNPGTGSATCEGPFSEELLSRLKSDFLAGLNHEIRTPLSGILGMLDLLLETPLTAQQKTFTDAAHTCAEDLLDQLNAALEFAALSAGRLRLHESDFNLEETLRAVVSQFRSAAEAKGLSVTASIDEALPPVAVADAVRLREVLQWLLGSVVKWTFAGELALDIHSGPCSQDAFSLEVTLHAPGEPPRVGLRLMLARALVELMRGRLAYETTRAGGTLATLSLPMTASTRVGLRLAAGARVLLVEDNRIAEQIAAHVLQQGGYRVHSVASGAAAVAEARQARYDLVLMDLEMPGMDGFSTTAALRRLPGWVDVPILALTAHSSDEARALCLHHGMCAFLSKPVSPEELLAAVARAVGR